MACTKVISGPHEMIWNWGCDFDLYMGIGSPQTIGSVSTMTNFQILGLTARLSNLMIEVLVCHWWLKVDAGLILVQWGSYIQTYINHIYICRYM